MCHTRENEQQQRVQAPVTIEVHQEAQQIETNVNPLVQVNVNANDTAVNVHEEGQNAQLLENAQQQLANIHADDVAPGNPIQEEAPAQQTWKERRRDKKKAKEAQKHCPVGTAVTFDLVTALQEKKRQKANFMNDHPEATPEVIDIRVLRTFARGHKQDKKGRPATAADAEAKALDDQYAADYLSHDLQRRAPHLERMLNEVLALRMDAGMFTDRYLRQHAGEMKESVDKMFYFNNVMNDPINRPFFDRLDPARREALEISFRAFVPFGTAFTMHFQKHGVNFNMAEYLGYDEEGTVPILQGREHAAPALAALQTELVRYHQDMAANRAAQTERVRNAAGDYAARIRANNAALNRVKQNPALGLRAGEENSPFLSRTAMLMDTAQTEEAFARNLETVRTALEIGRVPSGTRPSAETYERAKAFCLSTVEKILSCDVEELLSLTDEALMVRSGELNQLFMDNMFISDVMKLQHPTQNWHDSTVITLKEDMLGSRQIDFTYKQNILRGLAERARGLALLRQKQTGEVDGTFLTTGEQAHLADLEDYANSRIRIGATAIETAIEKRNKLRTRGTPEFSAYFMEMLVKGAGNRAIPNAILAAVSESIRKDTSPEALAIKERVSGTHYRNLAWSEAELKERGLRQNIGEAIFRSYTSFQCYEAAEKLLTPEQYRQMIKDLGAGAGMHKGKWTAPVQKEVIDKEGKKTTEIEMVEREGTPEELLQPAIEANKRGLAVYKNVLKAQYDMLERKYGIAIESLSVEEVMEHYTEIAKDFSDIQVTGSMQMHYPDFFDMDDPEDVKLMNRICYYSVLGNSAQGCFQGIAHGMITNNADIAAYMRDALTMKGCSEGRGWLVENHEGFVKDKIDWSQKVNVPGDAGQ